MALLTVAEVAQRLRLHEMTIRRHIKSGRLLAIRAGRRIRIPEEEVAAFANPQKPHGEMSPEELRAWILRERTPEELERMRKAFDTMKELRVKSKPLGMNTATLVRVSRRINEVAYGEKTWEELVAEES
jgi:excisionase family DNA binding protein